MSYDLTGKQKYVFRGGAGIFYNRPMGDTVYGMIEQPPSVVSPTLFYGRLQDIDPNNALVAPPTLFAFEYEGTFPKVYAFNAGVQMQLPWALVLDVSYVGTRSRDQHTQKNINAPDYGVAYLPQNQDPTLPASTDSWRDRAARGLPAPYQGYGNIFLVDTSAYANYNSLQTSLSRRFQKGMLFSFNYTLSKAMGTSSVDLPAGNNNPNPNVIGFPRNDDNQDEANYYPLDYDRRHNVVSQFVWELPKIAEGRHPRRDPERLADVGRLPLGVGHPVHADLQHPGDLALHADGHAGHRERPPRRHLRPRLRPQQRPVQAVRRRAASRRRRPAASASSPARTTWSGRRRTTSTSRSASSSSFGGRPATRTAGRRVQRAQPHAVPHGQLDDEREEPTPTRRRRTWRTTRRATLVNAVRFGTVASTRPSREIQLLARFQF